MTGPRESIWEATREALGMLARQASSGAAVEGVRTSPLAGFPMDGGASP